MKKTMTTPRAIVISGDGINCDEETCWALTSAGFGVRNLHVTELLKHPHQLKQCKLFCIPGGFAFGDEIASGKVLAIKIQQSAREILQEFIDGGNLVLGICNGFQVLVQMGLLPLSDAGTPRLVSLGKNQGGKFINRWFEMEVAENPKAQVFFAGLNKIELPIRHGEGNLKLEPVPGQNGGSPPNEPATIVKSHAALRYINEANGSYDRIAALCNKTGTVMGLMPHPEAFVRWTQHPQWTNKRWRESRVATANVGAHDANAEDLNKIAPDGFRIFQNAYKYVVSNM